MATAKVTRPLPSLAERGMAMRDYLSVTPIAYVNPLGAMCIYICTRAPTAHRDEHIMAYGSTPYVGMAPKKNGGQIKSAQMTRSKCLRLISQRPL